MRGGTAEAGVPARWRCPVTYPGMEYVRLQNRSGRYLRAVAGFTIRYRVGISRYHYERSWVPRIRIETNRKPYLNETYFDPERLRVDQRIIRKLGIFDAIVRFLTAL